MNTWNVARWMSEGKKVFNAVTTGLKRCNQIRGQEAKQRALP